MQLSFLDVVACSVLLLLVVGLLTGRRRARHRTGSGAASDRRAVPARRRHVADPHPSWAAGGQSGAGYGYTGGYGGTGDCGGSSGGGSFGGGDGGGGGC